MFAYNIAVSLIAAAASVYIFVESGRFAKGVGGGMGAGYWPSFLGGVLLLLSVCLLVETLWKQWRGAPHSPPPIQYRSPGMYRVYGLCGVFIVFALLLGLFGFMYGTLFLIPASMIILGERRWFVVSLVTVATPVTVHLVFTMLLGVELP